MLFSYENPPGTNIIAGSQDSIGIVYPGLNRIDLYRRFLACKDYDGAWRMHFILDWRTFIFDYACPRENNYHVLVNTFINKGNAEALRNAAENTWDALLVKDLEKFGEFFRKSFEAQIKMFPNMIYDDIFHVIDKYKDSACGWKLSGAGGGGYLIFVSQKPIKGAMQIKIRRRSP